MGERYIVMYGPRILKHVFFFLCDDSGWCPINILALLTWKRPPLVSKIFFVMNLGNMGIIRSMLVSRFQNSWNFCSRRSVAWEIMEKLPKKGLWAKSGHFRCFLMISLAMDMPEQKFQQFWNPLTNTVPMIPILH